MQEVSINKQAKLSPHFTIGELTKTSYHTSDGNIPSHVAIENLKRICGWLEILRERYSRKYGEAGEELPVFINSGYRSEEVNQKCGGAKGSKHLTGCAVDIKCLGPEQMIRYACLLLDIADEKSHKGDDPYCVIQYVTSGSGYFVTVTKCPDPVVTTEIYHSGVRTICDSHRFLTRDIFLRKNSQKVCLLRKYSYLCGVVRHYVKLKNFRLWETQNSKKLKIVLNFQDCLVVSNFLSTFANEYET